MRVGHFVLRNKWVPRRPEPTPELQAAPRVTHGSQRRGAAAALLAAGKPRIHCVVVGVRRRSFSIPSKHHPPPTIDTPPFNEIRIYHTGQRAAPRPCSPPGRSRGARGSS